MESSQPREANDEMPIYEYLCKTCNRVYSFLSPSYNPTKQPTCPKCGATDLTRQVSRFAFVRGAPAKSKGATAEGDDWGADRLDEPDRPRDRDREPDPFDNPRVEREMMKLMTEAEHMDENDPRQLGRFMRKMSELSGEPLEGEMEEAVRRLEMGEDPDKIEDDLGGVLGGDDSDEGFGGPSYDDGLYPF